MGFRCGIVGLPNVGKSTLFNALTETAAAQAANYPFCTIEPNVGRVAVPDPRLHEIARIGKSATIIETQLEFVDIAGLVRGASTGEGLGDFDVFHPERMASRILGMGDVLTLIEQAEKSFDAGTAERMAGKMMEGKEFDLEDFLEQMMQVKKMGSLSSLLGMLPGMGQMKDALAQVDDKDLDRIAAIIRSMTPQERRTPKILNGSRRMRIAKGSGVTVTEVNNLVDRFYDAQKMMKQMGGMAGMTGMPGLPGGRKAKRQQSAGKKGKKGPGRAGGGPARVLPPAASPGATPKGLPQGFPKLPQGFPPAPGGGGPPDPFGLRRPR